MIFYYLFVIIEDVLDPCNSGIAEGSTSDKKYRIRTHAKDIPHVSYASMMSCDILQNQNADSNNEINHDDWKTRRLHEVNDACSHLYDPAFQVQDKLSMGSFDELDNDSYRAWMDCTQ